MPRDPFYSVLNLNIDNNYAIHQIRLVVDLQLRTFMSCEYEWNVCSRLNIQYVDTGYTDPLE
jgi:hypothetical protein